MKDDLAKSMMLAAFPIVIAAGLAGSNGGVESKNGEEVLASNAKANEEVIPNKVTEYTCVWFDKENSAVLIPVYDYKMSGSSITLSTIDFNSNDVTIDEDYFIFKDQGGLLSHNIALAYAQAQLGDMVEITDYSDYVLEKNSLEEDTKTYVKSMQ